VPTPKLVQIESWSYSRFSLYNQCPAKAKYSIIEKRREPSSPAMENGNRVHAIADVFTSGQLPELSSDNAALIPELKKVLAEKKIPRELECFAEEFEAMQAAGALTEQQWAFDRDWNYLSPPNGWFSAKAWLRIKVDAHWLETVKKKGVLRETIVHVVDWKTGKFNPDHALQRSLYALGSLLVYPDASKVIVAHGYLDLGREEKETWLVGALEKLKKEWLAKTRAMLNDTTFAPCPSPLCKWCHYRKSNGGPCVY
jgi:CRISPR/Cas system-associated exonuclease Cas4 (RecB family)